jgi:hypothetical protein
MHCMKRCLAVLCSVVILVIGCVFMPISRGNRIAIETHAAGTAVIAGMTIASVVCVVLIWYGISVDSDSSDVSSCVDFVTSKAVSAGISKSWFLLNAWLYMEQLGAWVAEWIAAQSEIYNIVENAFDKYGSLDTNRHIYYTSSNVSAVSSVKFNINYHDYVANSCTFSSSVMRPVCFYGSTNGWFYILSLSSEPYTISIQTTDGSFSTTISSFYRPSNWGSNYPGMYMAESQYFGDAGVCFAGLLNFTGAKNGPSIGTDGLFSEIYSKLGSLPSISADIDRKIVVPAAKDVYDSLSNLDAYQLDHPDVIDFGSALSKLQTKTGNPSLTWDDVIDGVRTGDISASDVMDATDTVPYVLTDSRTGELATSDTPAEYVKPVPLAKDLSVPDAETATKSEPYLPKYDKKSNSKFEIPLFEYFPFCLPWDIYAVISSFCADPVAPQIEIPVGKFFANKKSFDGSAVKDYKVVVDLGDEKFSKWFTMLRVLESAGIVIGLCLVSVKLIHGGR